MKSGDNVNEIFLGKIRKQLVSLAALGYKGLGGTVLEWYAVKKTLGRFGIRSRNSKEYLMVCKALCDSDIRFSIVTRGIKFTEAS